MPVKNSQQFSLGQALLLYMCIIVILITLIPFDFTIPARLKITWATNQLDFITNIFLFIPPGFLFGLSRKNYAGRFCLQALGFGLLLSLAIECTQLFIPGRYTSPIDVLTNGLGAWGGAWLYRLFRGYLKENPEFRLLALQLPLMNVVYLLIPLMWLNSLAAGTETAHLWLMLLLGLFGVAVLASIYTHRLKKTSAMGPNRLSVFAMGWFYIGAIQMLTRYPLRIIIFGALIGAVAQILARLPAPGSKTERRFELPTLKKLVPLYVIYLFLAVTWPTTVLLDRWQSMIHFQGLGFDERLVFTFRFIELIAAFTLLGYLIAQMRGRKNEPVAKTLAWVLLAALFAAAVTALLKGPPSLMAAAVFQAGGISVACLYGAIIYRLQLAAVRGSTTLFF